MPRRTECSRRREPALPTDAATLTVDAAADVMERTTKVGQVSDLIRLLLRGQVRNLTYLLCLCLLVGAAMAATPTLHNPAQPTDAELAAFLTPEPGKTPAEALKTFETARG